MAGSGDQQRDDNDDDDSDDNSTAVDRAALEILFADRLSDAGSGSGTGLGRRTKEGVGCLEVSGSRRQCRRESPREIGLADQQVPREGGGIEEGRRWPRFDEGVG